MIIHQDTLLELIYDPASDILTVKWPNLVDVPAMVIQHSFAKLIDSINHYHISKLLLDSSGTVTNVPDAEYKPLAMKLTMDLAATRLQKIARVVSGDPQRETRAKEYNQEFVSKIAFNFKSKEFNDKESALRWLAGNED